MPVVGHEAFWAADAADAPLDRRPIGQILRDVADGDPDRAAMLWPDGEGFLTWAWRQLRDESEAFAHRLLTLAATGEVVAIFAANSPDWVLFEYGAAMAGITIAPINPALADAEVEHVLRACGARAVFADVGYRGSPLLARARSIAPYITAVDLTSWRDLSANDVALPVVDSDSAFLIQFTSGTTGKPKGAVLSHRAAFNCARYQMERMGGTADDVWFNALPLHHVGGSVCMVLAMLAIGGTTVLAPAFEAANALRLMQRSRATITGAVPTMQLALLDHPDFATTDLSALRLVSSGGSVVPTSLIHRVETAFGAVVTNAYGQSESPSAIMTDPDDDDVIKAQTIGRPLPQRDVRVARADGTTAAFDEVGELLMRSPLTMDGYLPGNGDGARTLDDDGWLHTGDLVAMDAEGVITIHGRVRDVVIRGGENIYPAEVEDVMLQHPGILDIAVVGVADERWGEVPVGCYRTADGAPLDPADLIEFGRRSLAGFKVPRRWLVVDQFPLTAAGKVKKFVLQQRLSDHSSARPTPLEEP